jgi:coenzyme F420-0:L-glutamate ligase / coenzyme F420-1:gamma-L-glutamate ligase
MTLILTPLEKIPLISAGDDLARIIIESVTEMDLPILEGDIFVVAQKVVSKSENRLVNLNEITPGDLALQIAAECEKDPRLIELILGESNCVLRKRPGTIIVEHKLGFVCANAGIDHSNVKGRYGNPEDWVLLLPRDPDGSAKGILDALQKKYHAKLGVLIIDSHGRPWRNGIVGISIGMAGVPGVVDLRGTPDLFDYSLKITQVGAADELAAAASLIMGQADEGTPIIHVHGFPYELRYDSSIKELIRDHERDLFR